MARKIKRRLPARYEALERRELLTVTFEAPMAECDEPSEIVAIHATPESAPEIEEQRANAAHQHQSQDDPSKEQAKILRENKRRWGNFQGLSGTALMEMARNYPLLYQEILAEEARLEKWLNDQNQPDAAEDNANDGAVPPAADLPKIHDTLRQSVGDDAYAEMLRANRQRWGNYQGVCGTGLIEMAQNAPDRYQEFLEAEAQLERWLEGQNQTASDQGGNDKEKSNEEQDQSQNRKKSSPDSQDKIRQSMGDKAFEQMLGRNKRRYGNYQGVCGSALIDMARNFPELYQQFLKSESQLQQWLDNRKQPRSHDDDQTHGHDDSTQQPAGFIVLPNDAASSGKINRAWARSMQDRNVTPGSSGLVSPNDLPPIRTVDQFQWWKLQGISPEIVERFFNLTAK